MTKVRCSAADLRKAAGSQSLGRLQAAVATGWTANEMDVLGQSGKNPLHMAAWKGCLANVQYLVEDVGCDVNVYSQGQYTYGKTAIFFACTQSRRDVVTYLLEHGAFVKIVNNKGQSVLSLAASHFEMDLVQIVADVEASQEGDWWNFRTPQYSDGLEYGDLDPRFLDRPLRSSDVVSQYAVNGTSKITRRGAFQRRNPQVVHASKPAKRTRKPRKQRQKEILKQQEDAKLIEIESKWTQLEELVGLANHDQKVASLLLEIVQQSDQLRQPWIPDAAKRLQCMATTSDFEWCRVETCMLEWATEREAKLIWKLFHIEESTPANVVEDTSILQEDSSQGCDDDSERWHEAMALACGLGMSVLEEASSEHLTLPSKPVWIDTVHGLDALTIILNDARLVALDTEWYDCTLTQSALVSTLQIAWVDSTSRQLKTYVVDLMVDRSDTMYRQSVNELLRALFSGDRLVLGFAFAHDATKLNAYVGKGVVRNVLDVQTLLCQDKSRMPSLQTCCAMFSSVLLSKEEQCSDWGLRPLSTAQLHYAALDAGILLVLLSEYQVSVVQNCT